MEPLKQPDAFITPMSCILSDIVKWTRKDVMIGPVRMFSMLTMRMNWKNMLENPLVNRPPLVKKLISKPKLLPKITRKTVAAVEIVKPRIVNVVCVRLLTKSLIGKEISLILFREPPVLQKQRTACKFQQFFVMRRYDNGLSFLLNFL